MFSRIIHHLDMKDVGKKHLEKLAATKIKEEKDKKEKLVIKEISKRFESNWRKELDEGLTTTNVFSVSLPAEGDQAIDQVNPTDAASFAAATGMIGGAGTNNAALDGTVIRSSGSGAGDDGGFNVGGDYLAFQGSGSGSSRWALLSPIDSSGVDTLTITAIRGTDSNGGEEPDVVGQEELYVIYKTPDMSQASYISQDRNQNDVGGINSAKIIPINSGDGTLQNYSVAIPEYARAKGTIFGLWQLGHSGSQYDHYGVTDIKFQRRTPLNVVVPLDSPEAVSFIRVGTDEGDPKKRKKKVNDQLAASDEYVAQQMGDEFPGQGARIDGEDPFRSAPITSDEEIKSSPIGKDEVKKSFSDFSDDAADATAEPEPEPLEPAVQTTLAPRNLDGTKLRVKSVGAKNSGIVQGADAANLDAKKREQDLKLAGTYDLMKRGQVPFLTPDQVNKILVDPKYQQLLQDDPDLIRQLQRMRATVDDGVEIASTDLSGILPPEPEIPDPEEIKASEVEKKEKTEKEIEKIEKEKYEAQEQKQGNKILDSLLNFAKQIDPLDMPIDFGINLVIGLVNLGKGVNQIRSLLKNISGGRFGTGGILGDPDIKLANEKYQKFFNNIEIMRSNLTGRITTQEYNSQQISDLAKTLTVTKFMGENFYGEYGGNYGISDTRHEYVDDNIYVLNGEVFTNDQGLKSLANMTTGAKSIDGIGRGYGQMIIPKDGGTPYFHFYDYNYHNLNSSSPDELPPGFMTKLGAQTAQVLRSFLPGRMFDDVINRIQGNLNTFGRDLKNRVGLDGWPPGIHGATLTDFKIPLNQLPQETQDYIALHPLSWTPERIANMSDDYLYEQTEILLNKEGIVYRDSDDGDSYFRDFYKLIRSKDIGLDPTYVNAVIGYNETWDKTQEALIEKAEFVESPEYEYNEAYMKASEDYDKAIDEYMEVADKLTSNEIEETAMREIPDPEGEYPEFDLENDPEVVRAKDAFEEALNKSYDHWDNEVQPAIDAYLDFASTLKEVGNMLEGTKSEIAQLRKLEKVGRAAVEENRRLDDEYERLEKIAADTAENYQKKYRKLVEPWKVADEKRQERIKELREMLYAEIDEKEKIMYDLEVKFQNTYTVRDVVDGVEIFTDGGDYTDLNGKTYDGRGTLLKPFDLKIQELNKQADEFWATQEQFGIRYLPEKLSPYLTKKQFKGKTVNWTPAKKGTGKRTTPAKPKPKPKYGRGYSVSDPIIRPSTPTKKKRKKRGSGFNENYSLFEKIKSKTFFNPKDIKPTFPENPPAQIDPKTGMHPNYGKQAKRYNKLDPMSANAMPPTGDPEIDAVVNKQRTKKKPAERKKEYIKVSRVTETKTFSKIKNLRKKK